MLSKRGGIGPGVFFAFALNFASATHPGGGFRSGARAQEEYLARSAGLYACLRAHPMYAFHRARHNTLYTAYVIYSPAVPVFRADDGALLESSSSRRPGGPRNSWIGPSRRTRGYTFPVVADMDFGHTAPQFTLPVGCRARIDAESQRFEVLDAGVE